MPGSLVARDISKSYAAVQVLDRVSLIVSPGDRIGIVGPNGIGKSTLLRVLAGIEDADSGRIVRGGSIGYLPQEPEARPGESVRDYLARRTGVGAAEHAMDSLAARLGAEPELANEYSDALDRFLALGGEDFDARVGAVLEDVGLGRRADREVASLSGGEAARAALAAILLARFDVFLLDEPTNNLDFAGLARLESFLDGLAAGVVLVSHDRAFLDRTITRIVAAAPPAGPIVSLRSAVLTAGAFALGPVDLDLHYGDRLAIVGANGAGKTMLIRAVTGELPLSSGELHVGSGAVFGELNQARDLLTGVLLDDFGELSGLPAAEARTLLAKFALGEDDVGRTAASLSPGERTRAALALLAARGVNCLILDEPTNHLDLEAIEELETALADYEGCLVVVTHDRRFLDRLTVTRRISL